MKNTTVLFIVICFLTCNTFFLHGQGCSDAGFCTINTIKPNVGDSVDLIKNQIKTGVFFGDADYSILAYGSYLEYNRKLNNQFGLDIKLTSLGQSGNDISVFGLSDLFFTANYLAGKNSHFTLGAKIPLMRADKSYNDLPLPMDYQASLGTFDLIMGIGYEIINIQFVAALQQPLSQNNNKFIVEDYPVNSELRLFQSTNEFKRSGDVLLRVSYPVFIGSKIKLTPSVLPIYHLKNDKFTDQDGSEKEIEGSQGLTLNGNIYADFQINSNSALQFNFAMPFIVRESRPDGLTRSLLVSLEYRIKF